MASHPSAAKDLLFGRTKYSLALSEALQAFVGNQARRKFSYSQLEEHTGVEARRIKAARANPDSGEWRPIEPEELLSLMAYMGSGFTNAVLKHVSQGAYDLPDPEGGDMTRMAPEIAGALTEVTGAAVRGENVVGIDTALALTRIGKQLTANHHAQSGQADLFAAQQGRAA